MNEELLVSVSAGLTRVALLAGELTQEVHLERADSPSLVGNLYVGRVQRLVVGMNSAFVDIGVGTNGLLAGSDLPLQGSIAKQLCVGQGLLVQVTRDASGDKGPRLTAAVTLASRYLVLAGAGARGRVSRRIRSEGERQRLRHLLSDIGAELGLDSAALIARTAADNVPASLLRADAQRLAARWQQHRGSAAQSARPRLILAEPPLPQRVLRDSVGPGIVRVVVDDPRSATDIRAWCDSHLPGPVPVVEVNEGPANLFQRSGVEAAIAAALLATVPLPSGGNLVIERTEAMVTVDVNTGAFTGHNDLEQTLLQTNLEAAAALPRQLRLRALGGIIAIDFIDMRESDHRRAVLLALEQALDGDPDAGAVTSVGKLGLVVLTRKQTRQPIAELLTVPCAHCGGSGRSPWPAAAAL